MCDTESDVDVDSHADARPTPEPGPTDDPEDVPAVLVARIQDPEDGPTELTLHPEDASGLDLMSNWITAVEGDYVTLDEMR